MYIYIDGDNSPGSRTDNISVCSKDEVIKLFYARNNTYYSKKNNRDDLLNKSKCNMEFIPIPAGNNSVDFAIAVHATKDLSEGKVKRLICFISADKHFDLIAERLMSFYPLVLIRRVDTVEDAILKYKLLEVESSDDFETILQNMFGSRGIELYRKLTSEFSGKRNMRNALSKIKSFKGVIKSKHNIEMRK